MFNCYLHGWSSRDDTCPKCIKIETVTTTTGTYPDYIVGISGQELERLRAENSTGREIKFNSETKEIHRMQLAACSTAALGNTEESKELRIGKENPYWTPAYQDVCGAVDREIQYRSALEEIVVEAIRSGLKHIEDKARAGLRGNVFIVNEDNTTYAITDYLLDGAALEGE